MWQQTGTNGNCFCFRYSLHCGLPSPNTNFIFSHKVPSLIASLQSHDIKQTNKQISFQHVFMLYLCNFSHDLPSNIEFQPAEPVLCQCITSRDYVHQHFSEVWTVLLCAFWVVNLFSNSVNVAATNDMIRQTLREVARRGDDPKDLKKVNQNSKVLEVRELLY